MKACSLYNERCLRRWCDTTMWTRCCCCCCRFSQVESAFIKSIDDWTVSDDIVPFLFYYVYYVSSFPFMLPLPCPESHWVTSLGIVSPFSLHSIARSAKIQPEGDMHGSPIKTIKGNVVCNGNECRRIRDIFFSIISSRCLLLVARVWIELCTYVNQIRRESTKECGKRKKR